MMTTTVIPNLPQPEVCLNAEVVTMRCGYERCNKSFTPRGRKKLCSTKCRVYASRVPNSVVRNSWVTAKMAYKSMAFDGRVSGSNNDAAGRLADWRQR